MANSVKVLQTLGYIIRTYVNEKGTTDYECQNPHSLIK